MWFGGEVKSPPFSPAARRRAGYLLRSLQGGVLLSMPDSRPLPTVGARCHELRIADQGISWRIVYHIDEDAIVILDVFKKQTQTLPLQVVQRAQQRLRRFLSSTGERGA